MIANAGNLELEQRDSRVEFVQRIAVEAFAGEEAGGTEVAFGRPPPRSFVVVHQWNIGPIGFAVNALATWHKVIHCCDEPGLRKGEFPRHVD